MQNQNKIISKENLKKVNKYHVNKALKLATG